MTPSASVDFSLLKDKLSTGALGVGAHVVYEKMASLNATKLGLTWPITKAWTEATNIT